MFLGRVSSGPGSEIKPPYYAHIGNILKQRLRRLHRHELEYMHVQISKSFLGVSNANHYMYVHTHNRYVMWETTMNMHADFHL